MNQKSDYQFIIIGLNPEPEKLKRLIRVRLEKRLKKGLIAEVRNLRKNGLSWQRLENLGLEYKFVALYLQDKLDRKDLTEKLNTAIWHYAKRQMTWWKRDARVQWLEQKSALKLRLKPDSIDTKNRLRNPASRRKRAKR